MRQQRLLLFRPPGSPARRFKLTHYPPAQLRHGVVVWVHIDREQAKQVPLMRQRTKAQAAGTAIACAARRGLPMLVLVGAISAGLAMTLPVAVGAAAGVIAIAFLVMTRRAPSISNVNAAISS